MTNDEKQLFSSVRSILWQKWDPIGVNDGDNEWDDEYDSYVPHIYRLALEGKDADRIKQSLDISVSQSMGMSVNHELNASVASLIVETKKRILG